MSPRQKINIGDKFTLNSGDSCEITEILPTKYLVIKFSTGNFKIVLLGDLRKGRVFNPNYPSVFGVGYEGCGLFSVYFGDGGLTKEGSLWYNMLRRCYDPHFSKRATYASCEVHKDWHNFQNFAEWCLSQTGFDEGGWELDKDILVSGNKIYSSETCIFIPSELNKFFKPHTDKFNVCKRGASYYSKVYINKVQTYSPKFDSFHKAANWYLEKKNETLKYKVEDIKHKLDKRFLNRVEEGYYVKL